MMIFISPSRLILKAMTLMMLWAGQLCPVYQVLIHMYTYVIYMLVHTYTHTYILDEIHQPKFGDGQFDDVSHAASNMEFDLKYRAQDDENDFFNRYV